MHSFFYYLYYCFCTDFEIFFHSVYFDRLLTSTLLMHYYLLHKNVPVGTFSRPGTCVREKSLSPEIPLNWCFTAVCVTENSVEMCVQTLVTLTLWITQEMMFANLKKKLEEGGSVSPVGVDRKASSGGVIANSASRTQTMNYVHGEGCVFCCSVYSHFYISQDN